MLYSRLKADSRPKRDHKTRPGQKRSTTGKRQPMTAMGMVTDMAVNTVATARTSTITRSPHPAPSVLSLCSHFNFGISIRGSESENAAGGWHRGSQVAGWHKERQINQESKYIN